jgi:PAS domain S-box-containing protein
MSLSGSGNITSEAESVRIPRTEEFYRKIYQQVATGIAITDWQGVFQECNPAYCALLGYTEKV